MFSLGLFDSIGAIYKKGVGVKEKRRICSIIYFRWMIARFRFRR